MQLIAPDRPTKIENGRILLVTDRMMKYAINSKIATLTVGSLSNISQLYFSIHFSFTQRLKQYHHTHGSES